MQYASSLGVVEHSESNAFSSGGPLTLDLDAALDALEGPLAPALAPESQSQSNNLMQPQQQRSSSLTGHAGAIQDLDFSMLDYFTDLSNSANLDDQAGLTPMASPSSTSGGEQRPRAASVGNILDQITDLPVPQQLDEDVQSQSQSQSQSQQQTATNPNANANQRRLVALPNSDEQANANADEGSAQAQAWREQKKMLLQPHPEVW